MSKIIATWEIELICVCPKCEQPVDLLSSEGFWLNNDGLHVLENGTKKSNNLEAMCPRCDLEFVVECQFE